MFTPPDYLSPSSIRLYQDCPQKFKINKFDNIKEPPSWATELGTFTHEVLEHLYLLDPSERTHDSVKTLASQLWADNGWEEKVLSLDEPKGDIKKFKQTAFSNMINLWNLENPQETFIDEMELEVESEVEGVRMRGFIDRLFISDDETAIISDYKTGRVPNPRYNTPDKQFFQLLAYALMLESANDVQTSQLDLLYLTESTKKTLEVTPALLATAMGTIVETKEALDNACNTGEFHCKVTNLCDWCHYKKTGLCPAFANK